MGPMQAADLKKKTKNKPVTILGTCSPNQERLESQSQSTANKGLKKNKTAKNPNKDWNPVSSCDNCTAHSKKN